MRTALKIAAGVAFAIAAAAAVGFAYLHSRYFAADELGSRPYPMRRIDVDFPPARDGIEYYGKLRLDVFINSDGGVDRVEVVESRLPAKMREIAVNAFTKARWEPGRKWGLPVKSIKVVEIDLEPPAGAVGRAATQPDL